MENKVSQEVLDLEESINDLDKEIEDISCANINSNNVIDIVNDDIEKINIKIKKIERDNLKKSLIRKIKKAGRFFVRVLPYIITTALSFVISTYAVNDTPFFRQPDKYYAIHEYTIYENETTDTISAYIDKPSRSNESSRPKAYYKSAWMLEEDGNYHRVTSEYYINHLTLEQAKKYSEDPNLSLNDIVFNYAGDNRKDSKETKSPSEITPEELNETGKFYLVFHYTDDTDFVIQAQPSGSNIVDTVFFLFISSVLACGPLMIRLITDYREKYDLSMFLLDKKYKEEDISELKKLLEEKKLKFEVVKHDKVSLIDPITAEKTVIK
jgi:hypothetical protein